MAPVALERSQFAREGMMETLVGLIRVGVASGARIAADAMYEEGLAGDADEDWATARRLEVESLRQCVEALLSTLRGEAGHT